MADRTHRIPARALLVRVAVVLGIALAAAPPARAQSAYWFGKNKITYQTFDWHIYRAPHFDVYYYPEGEPFLEQVVSYAESAYLYLSKELDHEPKFRIPLIYYRTHAEFEQTNIMVSWISEGILAFAEPLEHRVALPIDLPPDRLYDTIVHEMTHIFEYSILYQDSYGRALRGSAPGWLMEGLASYLAKDEDSFDQMYIRDAVIHGLVPPITQVRGVNFLVYRYGHAAFDFIEQEWGKEGLRTFLSEYRRVLLSRNIEKSIKEAFGIEASEFDRRFQRFLRRRYLPHLLERGEPEDYGKEIGFKLPGVMTFSPVLSPSGDLVAALTNRYAELDVVVLSAKDGELIKNLTKGFTNEYEFLSTQAFNGRSDLSWSPDGDQVAVFARKENRRILIILNALTGRRVGIYEVRVANAASPAFSPDGSKILFSGNMDGIVDIFELDLATREVRNITDDEYYDSDPSWSADGQTILYNRRVDAHDKIFLLDYQDPSRKTQVTFGPSSDITPSFSQDGRKVFYASNEGEDDIYNIYSLDLETGEVNRYTDVMGGFFHPRSRPSVGGKDTVVASTFVLQRFRLFEVDVSKPLEVISPEERATRIGELQPFEPPLKLTVDDDQKEPLTKRTYHVETTPTVGVGVASDGTVIGDAYIVFSDLLGDNRFWVNVQSVANYQNIDLGYINMKSRLHHFYSVQDYRDFIVLPVTSTTYDRVEANRVTSGEAGISYPLNRYYRLAGSFGVQARDILDAGLTTVNEDLAEVLGIGVGGAASEDFKVLTFDQLKSTNAVFTGSLIGDTTRWNQFGPWHGKRFDLTVQASPFASGERDAQFVNYRFDYRAYARVTRRSTLAFRFNTFVSTGEGANLIGIGGFNQIRGIDYRELIGDRAAYMNLELRFPLVDNLQLPFGSIRWIRAFMFLDAGSAWTQEGLFYDRELGDTGLAFFLGQTGIFRDFSIWNDELDILQDVRASYGIGFNLRMGIFTLNWSFAKRLPFAESDISTCNADINNATTFEEITAALGSCGYREVPTGSWRGDFYIVTEF